MLGLSLENLYFFFARKYKIALTIIVGLFFSEHIFSYNSFFIFDSPLRIHVWDGREHGCVVRYILMVFIYMRI